MIKTDELKALAGTHLGKAGDGSLVKPYVTPKEHDKTLLVPLPRKLNREKSNIKSSTSFVGFEVWHAYEMSFLLKNGMPITGLLKIRYSSDSESMVESKSLKLYLNSFDLERFEKPEQVEKIIKEDLSQALKDDVQVCFHEANQTQFMENPFDITYFPSVDEENIEITEYRENPELLENYKDLGEDSYVLKFHTSNLRSNCEITNQKDTGNCYIFMESRQLPTIESLTRYIFSMRESQHFHENLVEIVYDTLSEKFNPDKLFVAGIYNRRGGISIHSVRATDRDLIDSLIKGYDNVDILFEKLPQE